MFEKNKNNLNLLEKELHSVKIPEGFEYKLPPISTEMLKGEFIDYKTRSELTNRYWVDSHFANPQGTVQGGILAACFDDTFGPLGVITSRKPILTIDLNIQYIRPVQLEENIYIKAKVISVSKTTLFMRADALNQKGKLLAQASTNQQIIIS